MKNLISLSVIFTRKIVCLFNSNIIHLKTYKYIQRKNYNNKTHIIRLSILIWSKTVILKTVKKKIKKNL